MRAIVIAFLLAIMAVPAAAQSGCDAPQTIANVQNQVRQLGQNNAEWVFRSGLRVPYFRMREVSIAVVSVSFRGQVRTGVECQIVLRLTTPPDVVTPNSVVMQFGYVIMPDGNVDLF